MSKGPLEKKIEQRVIRTYPKALALKVHKRDWPDRLFLLPGGRCFFVEFKRKGENLRPGQKLARIALKERGFEVFRIDNAEQGKGLIDSLKSTYEI